MWSMPPTPPTWKLRGEVRAVWAPRRWRTLLGPPLWRRSGSVAAFPVALHYKAAERVGGRQYDILTLPSGEAVIGRMAGSTAGTTESGEPLYQLPIARWNHSRGASGGTGRQASMTTTPTLWSVWGRSQ